MSTIFGGDYPLSSCLGFVDYLLLGGFIGTKGSRGNLLPQQRGL